MILLLAAFLSLANPLYAQNNGNCTEIKSCPEQFMPAPSPASTSAIQNVAAALTVAADADKVEDAAAQDLENRYEEIRARLANSYRMIPRRLANLLLTDEKVRSAALADQEYVSRQEKLLLAAANNYEAHNAVILEVVNAYHLLPPVMDFAGDPRAASLNMVAKRWLPHYSRHEKRDGNTGQWRKRNERELAQEQLDNALGGGGVMAARTRGNGVIELYGQAFSSPEDLAINIFHETSHWVDIAAKPGGFNYGSDLPEVSFRTEQHAYERAATFALQIGANAQKQLVLAKQFELQAKESEEKHLTWPQVLLKRGWIGRDRGMMAMAPAESEISPGDEELLRQKMDEAQARTNARAREQLEISHRDHDERLRNTKADMARRSCESPGSVTQAELDGLPDPYVQDEAGWAPGGLSQCADWVYMFLGRGVDAMKIQQESTPTEAVAATPVPQPGQFNGVSPYNFVIMLPSVKDFAVASCRSPGQVPIPVAVTLPYENIRFFPAEDEREAGRLSTGLGQCEGRLFRKLIELIRGGYGASISNDWMKDAVRLFTPPAGSNDDQTIVSPPFQKPPGGDPCRDHGNVRCP
jgi:hypothetical protein